MVGDSDGEVLGLVLGNFEGELLGDIVGIGVGAGVGIHAVRSSLTSPSSHSTQLVCSVSFLPRFKLFLVRSLDSTEKLVNATQINTGTHSRSLPSL